MAYRHINDRASSRSGNSAKHQHPHQQQQQQQHDYSGDERESQRSGGNGGTDRDDKPTYLLEHLATFTVNKESGILYPADGMRRLLQLEKTTGIWSQKMQLCLDYPWVLIMDHETENIIERFPATLIQEPTAFTSNNTMELYNNILVFIVSGGSGARSEMHIFQSQNVSAVHLVEDLKRLRNGKVFKQHLHDLDNQSPLKQQQQQHLQQERGGGGGPAASADTDSERDVIGVTLNDETSSTCSDKYERDVTVLNHCFDDIEKFIARLQHAAAALRELERRRRNRKSKKKESGEGLLTLRTRPPMEKEFMDIFAKFKLSFNLLAKLKSHIHDPNAPELVHFLFTPLALIVEAANDTYYDAQLPANVINPLLTREAINLLINCVTSKETELWRSLGDAWTVPRDQWKDNVGSYHPVFMDGWSPDYLVIDELDHTPASSTPTAGGAGVSFKKRLTQQDHNHQNHNHHANNGSGIGSGGGGAGGAGDFTSLDHFAVYGGHAAAYDFSSRSKMSLDSIEQEPSHQHDQQQKRLNGVDAITAGLQHLQPIHESVSNNNNSNNNSNNNNNNNSQEYGMDEHNMVASWLDELQSTNAKIVLVTYPRTANNDKELSVVRGEYLEILDDTRKWWKARNMRGQVAHVPHTIVTPYNYEDVTDGSGANSTNAAPFKNSANKFLTNFDQMNDGTNSQLSGDNWQRNKLLGKKGEFRYF